MLQFAVKRPNDAPELILPVWKGEPKFTEHSYRSFAADAPSRELILFQNIGYTHTEWTFRDSAGQWSAQGQLRWPSDTAHARAGPIRVCYPDVALRDRAVHFIGVSDVLEPNPAWRAFIVLRKSSISTHPAIPADEVRPAAPHTCAMPSRRGSGMAKRYPKKKRLFVPPLTASSAVNQATSIQCAPERMGCLAKSERHANR